MSTDTEWRTYAGVPDLAYYSDNINFRLVNIVYGASDFLILRVMRGEESELHRLMMYHSREGAYVTFRGKRLYLSKFILLE